MSGYSGLSEAGPPESGPRAIEHTEAFFWSLMEQSVPAGSPAAARLREPEVKQYLAERVLPALVPGLTHLAKAVEANLAAVADGEDVLEIVPKDFLAQYLFRHNPRYAPAAAGDAAAAAAAPKSYLPGQQTAKQLHELAAQEKARHPLPLVFERFFPPGPLGLGFGVLPDGRYAVNRVDGAAEEQGVEVADTIEAVGGEEVAGLDKGAFVALLKRLFKPRKPVPFTFSRVRDPGMPYKL